MPNITKLFLVLGSLSALSAVALGAFGAHALRKTLGADLMAIYQTGVQYHFYHALGLLIVALMTLQWPASVLLKWSGWLMVMGMILFSGSLYALSISGVRWLGAITPFGGTAFLAAWLLLLIATLRSG